MKNFQQNLLIGLALALCGLCAWQWHFQTVQRGELAVREQEIYQRDTAVQSYTNELNKTRQQVGRMEESLATLNTNFAEALRTNTEIIIQQKRDIARLSANNDTLTNEIAQYTNAVAALQSNLDTAYAGIKRQNASIEQLEPYVGKYTNTVSQYNALVTNYNDLFGKYTNLVDRFNKLQAAPATNAPRK
jgi:chromosome segregation ATPase